MPSKKMPGVQSCDERAPGERNERFHALLSRAQVLALLGPLLISIEGVDPSVARAADLYNLGVHDVARALLAVPDDARSPLEEESD